MRITTRIRLSLGAMVVLVLLASVGGYVALSIAAKAARFFPDNLIPSTVSALTAETDLQRYARAIAGNAPDGQSAVSLQRTMANHMLFFEKLKAAAAIEEVRGMASDVLMAWSKLEKLDPAIPATANSAEFVQMEKVLSRVVAIVGQRTEAGGQKIMGVIDTASMVLLAGGVLAAALGVLVSVLLARAIITPVAQLEGAMRKIADSSDLTHRADLHRADEFGSMAKAFDGMVGQLQTLVVQVRAATDDVSQEAERLARDADGLRDRAVSQSEAVSANAAAIEELTVSIATVTDAAADVRGKSQDSVNDSLVGNQKVTYLVGEIRLIQRSVEEIAAAVEEFVKSTSAITHLTQEVREIADQTNLLALNAAIEAARAGEQGRGFAVVADEVRKLAEKSGSSAGEINAVAQSIIAQSDAVRTAIEHGHRAISQSTALAGEVESTLATARRSVEQAGTGVAEIVSAVTEQRGTSVEIAQNMERIASIAEEASATSRDVSSLAGSLRHSASDLQSAVSRFKV